MLTYSTYISLIHYCPGGRHIQFLSLELVHHHKVWTAGALKEVVTPVRIPVAVGARGLLFLPIHVGWIRRVDCAFATEAIHFKLKQTHMSDDLFAAPQPKVVGPEGQPPKTISKDARTHYLVTRSLATHGAASAKDCCEPAKAPYYGDKTPYNGRGHAHFQDE